MPNRDDDRTDARARDAHDLKSETYRFHCGDRTCGAPDCGTCRNGTPPWKDDEPSA